MEKLRTVTLTEPKTVKEQEYERFAWRHKFISEGLASL
jgi:hypothetical protein